MNTQGFKPNKVGDLRGAQPAIAAAYQDPSRAVAVRNCISVQQGLKHRDGFVQHISTAGKVRKLHHWPAQGIINPDRLLLYKDDRSLSIHYNQLNIDQPLITFAAGTNDVTITELENRIYTTPRNGDSASGGVYIIEPNDSVIDPAFMPPFAATITVTDDGVGECTPGLHKFVLLGTSRTGFRGRLSPVVGSTLTPAEFTVTSPDPVLGRKLNVHISIGAIPELATVELAMTTVDNPNRYILVSDGAIGVSPAGIEFDFDVNIADDILASLETTDSDVTEQESWITRTPGSNADPIGCTAAMPYGDRMVYLCGTVMYISEPQNPQQISADQHLQRLKNGKFITAGFSIRGAYYGASLSTVEVINDSRNVPPAAWAPFNEVSGTMGIPSQNCIAITLGQNSGSSYALIANQAGFWYFDGNFSQKPINYRQEDTWKRINWAQAAKIRIVDDTVNRMAIVLAPRDGATEANVLMVFDYSRSRNEFGMIPSSMDYYEFDLSDYSDITAINIFHDYATNRLALMVAMTSGVNTILAYQKQDTAYDFGIEVPWLWRNGGCVHQDRLPARMSRFGGIIVCAEGDGFIHIKVESRGGDYTFEDDIELLAAPKIDWNSGLRINGQNVSVEFSGTTSGAGFLIREFITFIRPISNVPGRLK